MRPPDPLVDALRRRRLELGLSASQVADACGASTYAITSCELGRRGPTLGLLRPWANALGMQLGARPIRGMSAELARQAVVDAAARTRANRSALRRRRHGQIPTALHSAPARALDRASHP